MCKVGKGQRGLWVSFPFTTKRRKPGRVHIGATNAGDWDLLVHEGELGLAHDLNDGDAVLNSPHVARSAGRGPFCPVSA